ncbi:MAG TPA: hypothetical protein VFH48_42480, partial [Chloroflexota bacterium]|nr:hypothetical protein [Chloroflexota bacterium]
MTRGGFGCALILAVAGRRDDQGQGLVMVAQAIEQARAGDASPPHRWGAQPGLANAAVLVQGRRGRD